MDVAPRSAFMSAVIAPTERTAAMGIINVVKISAQSAGPWITGALGDRNLFWVAFVIAGVMKAIYDFGVLVVFAGHKSQGVKREERVDEAT